MEVLVPTGGSEVDRPSSKDLSLNSITVPSSRTTNSQLSSRHAALPAPVFSPRESASTRPPPPPPPRPMGGGRRGASSNSNGVALPSRSPAKRCQESGCERLAVAGEGGGKIKCVKHGGGRRCAFLNCKKSAINGGSASVSPGTEDQPRQYFCCEHGGGRRCNQQGCDKLAVPDNNGDCVFCTAHGGGKRCTVPGCNRSVLKKEARRFCIEHFVSSTATTSSGGPAGVEGAAVKRKRRSHRPPAAGGADPTSESADAASATGTARKRRRAEPSAEPTNKSEQGSEATLPRSGVRSSSSKRSRRAHDADSESRRSAKAAMSLSAAELSLAETVASHVERILSGKRRFAGAERLATSSQLLA